MPEYVGSDNLFGSGPSFSRTANVTQPATAFDGGAFDPVAFDAASVTGAVMIGTLNLLSDGIALTRSTTLSEG